MKKRKWVAFIAVVLVMGIAVGATAAGLISEIRAEIRKDFEVVIDGKTEQFKNVDGERVYPILYEGTTYLPLRAIGEIMGKKVYWYEDDKRIELKEEQSTVTDADVIVNGEQKPEKPKEDKAYIGEEKAKKIALDKAGLNENQVKALKVKLDLDDGIRQYEVEFSHNYVEYDVDIDAVDGEILKFEKDID